MQSRPEEVSNVDVLNSVKLSNVHQLLHSLENNAVRQGYRTALQMIFLTQSIQLDVLDALQPRTSTLEHLVLLQDKLVSEKLSLLDIRYELDSIHDQLARENSQLTSFKKSIDQVNKGKSDVAIARHMGLFGRAASTDSLSSYESMTTISSSSTLRLDSSEDEDSLTNNTPMTSSGENGWYSSPDHSPLPSPASLRRST